jgi:hypothetical protein
MGKPTNFALDIDLGDDAVTEELNRAIRLLRDEIGDLEVESVEIVKEGKIPEGAKGADPALLGGLVLTLLPAVVPKLLDFLRAWIFRGDNRKIKLKTRVGERSVEVEFSPSTVSTEEVKRVIESLTETLKS